MLMAFLSSGSIETPTKFIVRFPQANERVCRAETGDRREIFPRDIQRWPRSFSNESQDEMRSSESRIRSQSISIGVE